MALPTQTIEYTEEKFRAEAAEFLVIAESASNVEVARERIFEQVSRYQYDMFREDVGLSEGKVIRVRDCARAMRSLLKARSDSFTGFSVARVLFDLGKRNPRPDLQPGFFADLMHIIMGLETRGASEISDYLNISSSLTGRRAALARSNELDRFGKHVEERMQRYAHGLQGEIVAERLMLRDRICRQFGASTEDWNDWRWHLRHVIRDAHPVLSLVHVTKEELEDIRSAREARIPVGITPYYLSLMDCHPSTRDRAIRAQVIPNSEYIEQMKQYRTSKECDLDFMREHDTSPIDLITRRYPGIVIFKPYNTCPQICVYCQRNWEITDVLSEEALASTERIDAALAWIRDHPTIREVLVTGGDPLTLDDDILGEILQKVAAIPSVERIRIGTRTPVTLPMRFTESLAQLFGSLRVPGKREIAVVTHVEHPYEITPDMVTAVDRLRREGIPVYNQLVYTFYVSRRFEAALLRRLLRLAGIDPYYTFNTKGKEETKAYRVPIARLLQEQKEEARILPGLERTDEAVFNVPGLGKNYLRAYQHHDLLSIRPDGSRIYEFHPWEKNIAPQSTYIGEDIPILDYLNRLREIGEDPADYQTIWYYF
ncbi:MAG TPA: KamA family radical SAM protein [bacterium]|nr:KamA family radical SAM protein [bacterium]HQL63914.1 KamA family radical SAM protein [bacterium]